jgi:CHAT domain-containing protein
MSLWEVDDTATSEFMISFYSNLLSGRTHWDSYRRTLDEMRRRWKRPKDWAGFILLD